MSIQREKFATQMSPRVLSNLRAYAKSENRQIQAVLEEAVNDLLKKHGFGEPDPDFMDAVREATERYPETLKYLAS